MKKKLNIENFMKNAAQVHSLKDIEKFMQAFDEDKIVYYDPSIKGAIKKHKQNGYIYIMKED